MSAAVATAKQMTVEEFEALPDDGAERWLIRGVLWERKLEPGDDWMTKRNRFHSRVLIRVGFVLERWLELQPEPRGQVVGGEAGFILRRNPDSAVGIDVAYVAADAVAILSDETTLFDGPPVLAAEILSPNNTHREVASKVLDYLEVGVRLVWVIDPDLRTVTVYSPSSSPLIFSAGQTISADPELPGFSAPVADFFR